MTSYVKGNAVENATSYELLEKTADGYNSLATANEINFEVSALELADGDHIFVVKAKADGYEDSDYSNEVSYTVPVNTPTEPDEPDEPDTPSEPTTITSLESYETHQGFVGGTGAWNNINEKYAHVVVPVSGETTVDVTAGETTLYYIGLRSYTEPVKDAMPDYSTAYGWTGRNVISASQTRTLNVPSDVKYLVFVVINNTANAYPASITITTGG